MMCASVAQPQPHPYYTLRLGGVVQSMRFTQLRGNHYLIAGGSVGEVWLVSMATKRPVWTNEIHSGKTVLQVDMLAEGTAITYGRDQCLCVWNLTDKGLELKLSIKQEQYSFCNFSTLPLDEGRCLACMSGPECSLVRVLRLEQSYEQMSEAVVLRAEKAKECTGVKLASREREGKGGKQVLVVAVFLSGQVIIWELESAVVLFCIERMLGQECVCMDFDSDRLMGVVGGMEGALGVFRIKRKETSEEVLHDVLDISLKSIVNCVRLRGDKKVVACTAKDHEVVVLSWKSLKPLVQLKYHEDSLFDIQYGTEGGENTLAVSSKDKRVSLWKLY